MNVNLHIERLVLDSIELSPRQFQLLQQAVETELARELSTGEISPALINTGATRSLRTGEIQLSSPLNPGGLGNQIAQAVSSSLKV